MKATIICLIALILQAGAAEPPGWREANSKALDLTLAGKELELVAIYEKFVAQYPNFADAHFRLGAAHENVARAAMRSGAKDPIALRAKHYEMAIREMRRGLELAGRNASFDWYRGFIDIHGIVGVDRPAEYERLVREGVVKYPADPYAHGYMITMLAGKGQPIDAAVKAARAAIPKTADARDSLAGFLAQHVSDFRRLMPEPGVNAVLTEASSLIDEALKMKPGDAGALRTRALIDQLRKAKQ
jgi:hypothetical protein